MDANEVVSELEKVGYFKFVPQSELAAVKKIVKNEFKTKYSVEARLIDDPENDLYIPSTADLDLQWITSYTRRYFWAEGEDLAEGSLPTRIETICKILEPEGVKIESISDERTEESYSVTINGKKYVIYYNVYNVPNRNDTSAEAMSYCRMVQIINELLANAGSKEKVYSRYMEYEVVILSPEVARCISSLPVYHTGWDLDPVNRNLFKKPPDA